MALAIKDTTPVRGEQAEALLEAFYQDAPEAGALTPRRLDARLSPAAIEVIQRLANSAE